VQGESTNNPPLEKGRVGGVARKYVINPATK
jgi:hypothetical protein